MQCCSKDYVIIKFGSVSDELGGDDMVIFTDWFVSPVIPRSACGLPMPGEDTGLEAVASPMVGYLGKVQERATSLDHCPWCHSKGQIYPLHCYRINLEESITLCTNPQCLFPLVSRSLEDVLASLVPVEAATGNKRKNSQTSVANEPSILSPKRPRLEELETSQRSQKSSNDGEVHNTADTCSGQCIEEHADAHIGSETKPLELQEDPVLDKDSDSCTGDENVSLDKSTGVETLQVIDNQEELTSKDNRLNGEDHCLTNTVDRNCTLPDGDIFPMPVQTESIERIESVLSVSNIDSECEDISFTEINTGEDLVPPPVEIFWRNKDNLCWLDSLLVALVNLKNVRKLKPKDEPEQSPVWTLLAACEEARANIQSQQQTDKDGSLKIPYHLLHKINTNFETLRMSFFSLLQPKLHCKLGEKETPVFALPLLVKLDSWLESLFQFTFHWDFRCSNCKSNTKENVVNTLPTFTNIVPDWHPLMAVHLAPCNSCLGKNQRRRMVLQEVAPVFALHFVEGLPDNNIQVYNFNFKKKHYFVSAIIQYSSQLKHFITWVHKCDGSWVEFDDLKHPHCEVHKTFPVPAPEIHVVFWEEEQREESQACSPSTTITKSPPSAQNISYSATDWDMVADDLLQCSPDQSLLNPQNNSDIMDGISEQDTTVTAGVDIGSTTLLDTFEGLTHNDIVTLTLVEIKGDSNMPPSNSTNGEVEQAEDLKNQNVSNKIENSVEDIGAPAPDSSSTNETMEKVKLTCGELGTVSEPEDTRSEQEDSISEEDNMDNDPTFELKPRRGQKRGRSVAPNQVKRPKMDLHKGKVAATSPEQCKPTLSATSKAAPVVSSSVPAPENVFKNPPLSQQEQKGWSHLLERSLGHIQNTCKLNTNQKPIVHLKRGPVTPTPQPQKNAALPKVVPKLKLRTENTTGLPLKAAEMYGAFGSKNDKPNSTTVNVNKMPLATPVQKAETCGTLVNTSLNSSFSAYATDITSSKRTKSPKMPSGLSETEILRYKLCKKLKAKKKKLAKLNEMLGQSGDASFKPDSTNHFSPNTVTSSTLDDEFLSDLLSPATTITSDLSPDSTDFLEMLASGQDATVRTEMPSNSTTTDVLDEFMAPAVVEKPIDMDDLFSEMDMFF